MHYSFIISERQGQIDLHFEPNSIFSDLSTNTVYTPDEFGDLSTNTVYTLDDPIVNTEYLFPYRVGMIEEMLNKFQLIEYCGKNVGLIIIRINESNSAKYNDRTNLNIENCMLSEYKALGFRVLLIDADHLYKFCANLNSLNQSDNYFVDWRLKGK